MKHPSTTPLFCALLAVFAAPAAWADVPLPSVTYYGCVRDAYGYPFKKDAEVVLMKGGVECSRYLITGERSPGVNYRMEVEIDNGGTPFEAYAVHVDSQLDVKVYYQGQSLAVLTNATITALPAALTVPAAGSAIRLNIQTGVDADGDGLPDAWEQLLIAQSAGALQTLADVKPEDDFDGDGSDNLHEFRSGTFPFLKGDSFAIDALPQTSNGRFSFRFLAVAGFTYQVRGAVSLTGPAWGDQPFATAPDAAVATGLVFGDDTFKTLYVEATNSTAFVRLSIK